MRLVLLSFLLLSFTWHSPRGLKARWDCNNSAGICNTGGTWTREAKFFSYNLSGTYLSPFAPGANLSVREAGTTVALNITLNEVKHVASLSVGPIGTNLTTFTGTGGMFKVPDGYKEFVIDGTQDVQLQIGIIADTLIDGTGSGGIRINTGTNLTYPVNFKSYAGLLMPSIGLADNSLTNIELIGTSGASNLTPSSAFLLQPVNRVIDSKITNSGSINLAAVTLGDNVIFSTPINSPSRIVTTSNITFDSIFDDNWHGNMGNNTNTAHTWYLNNIDSLDITGISNGGTGVITLNDQAATVSNRRLKKIAIRYGLRTANYISCTQNYLDFEFDVIGESTIFQLSSTWSGNHDITVPITGSTNGPFGRLVFLNAFSGLSGNITINDGGYIECVNNLCFGTSVITLNPGGTLNLTGKTISNTIINNGGTIIP